MDKLEALTRSLIQTNKMWLANQSDNVVVDKQDKKAIVVDVVIPSDSIMMK